MPDELGRPCMQHDPMPCGPHYSPIFQPDTRDDVDPTPPPVPAEPYPGAGEVRKLALNTFWPVVQDRADELGLESTADGIDSRLLVAINRGLYAAGAAIYAAGVAAGEARGRTAAAADIREAPYPDPSPCIPAWHAGYTEATEAAARIAEGEAR